MVPLELSRLPPNSPVMLVARGSARRPEFVLADRANPRFSVARWHRSAVALDDPVKLEQHLLSYCVQGGAFASIVLDGTRLSAHQHTGSVSFLPAGAYQRWRLMAPREVVHVHLYIAANLLEGTPGVAPDAPSPGPLLNVRDPWFDGFFRLLTAEYEACSASGRLQDLDLLDRMGPLLLRRLTELRQPADIAHAGTAPLRPWLLRQVQDHIDRHLAHRITLDHLSTIASMSVDHFVRTFQQATGTTPHRWLLLRRLEVARMRLRESSDRIETIARDCGFSGAAHFSATFRRHHKTTPGAYRRSG